VLEEEENNNETTDEEHNEVARGSNEQCYDALSSSMDNYCYFLENFTREMDIKNKLKIFRESVSGAAGAGAGIADNHKERLQDVAAMSRKISLLKNAMEYELGI
jgi:hypothetical protein